MFFSSLNFIPNFKNKISIYSAAFSLLNFTSTRNPEFASDESIQTDEFVENFNDEQNLSSEIQSEFKLKKMEKILNGNYKHDLKILKNEANHQLMINRFSNELYKQLIIQNSKLCCKATKSDYFIDKSGCKILYTQIKPETIKRLFGLRDTQLTILINYLKCLEMYFNVLCKTSIGDSSHAKSSNEFFTLKGYVELGGKKPDNNFMSEELLQVFGYPKSLKAYVTDSSNVAKSHEILKFASKVFLSLKEGLRIPKILRNSHGEFCVILPGCVPDGVENNEKLHKLIRSVPRPGISIPKVKKSTKTVGPNCIQNIYEALKYKIDSQIKNLQENLSPFPYIDVVLKMCLNQFKDYVLQTSFNVLDKMNISNPGKPESYEKCVSDYEKIINELHIEETCMRQELKEFSTGNKVGHGELQFAALLKKNLSNGIRSLLNYEFECFSNERVNIDDKIDYIKDLIESFELSKINEFEFEVHIGGSIVTCMIDAKEFDRLAQLNDNYKKLEEPNPYE